MWPFRNYDKWSRQEVLDEAEKRGIAVGTPGGADEVAAKSQLREGDSFHFASVGLVISLASLAVAVASLAVALVAFLSS